MAKTLAEQIVELQRAAEVLPIVQKEIQKIAESVGRLKQLLGGEPTSRRKAAPKVAAKTKRERRARKFVTLKDKVFGALEKGPQSVEQLTKVDGRAVARTLDKWVALGILEKNGKGLYSKA
ncbi:MAG: hypothetical protein N3D11_08570 [Candidatus Sumerlaeia bacterium]|nr:hypothetical protein [Candidatus Sumerlaeia bacterium]